MLWLAIDLNIASFLLAACVFSALTLLVGQALRTMT